MSARGRAAAQEQAHSLVIDGTRVDLVLRRSARRSFALQVDHRGARVAVPLRTPLGEVERSSVLDALTRLPNRTAVLDRVLALQSRGSERHATRLFELGALVIDMLSSKGEEESPVWQRIFWALLVGAIAVALLIAGGLVVSCLSTRCMRS